jgi:hypothetical protein
LKKGDLKTSKGKEFMANAISPIKTSAKAAGEIPALDR